MNEWKTLATIFGISIIVLSIALLMKPCQVFKPIETCRNETIGTAFTWDASEGNVKCHINDTLTERAVEVNYPYTMYTCIEEFCDKNPAKEGK